MSMRTVVLMVAAVYFVFSVVYLVLYGFEQPRHAVWIGLVGIVVIAVALGVRSREREK